MNTTDKPGPRAAAQFLPLRLGSVVATPGIVALLDEGRFAPRHLLDCLGRHKAGDWGEMDAHDSALNDQACCIGERVHSAFPIDPAKPYVGNNRLWIITERDRSVTTFLLPEEY